MSDFALLRRYLAGRVGPEPAALERLIQRLEKLEEFVVAHDEVDRGLVNFDLHNAAVTRLERAREALNQHEEAQ